jgi:hypothetical protein
MIKVLEYIMLYFTSLLLTKILQKSGDKYLQLKKMDMIAII